MIAIATSSSISVKARIRGIILLSDASRLTGFMPLSPPLTRKSYSPAESALPPGAFPLNFSAHGSARFV
jgi:hypothetical protein